MRFTKRTNLSVTILLMLFGLTCILVLPGLPVGRAATTPHPAGQKASSSGLDGSRQAAMEKLYSQLKAGDPFSEEEGNILRTFGAGDALTDLEADVVISRALFDYYIAAKALSKEQEELLGRYTLSVARRSTDVADLKTQLLNKRKAAAAAAPSRTTPLAPPGNDLCSGAEVIPAAGPFPYLTAVTADITDATTTSDPPLPSCQTNVSRSIWYTLTPSATGRYTISTCAFDGTSTTVDDTVMAIYTSAGGCAGPFTEIPTGGASDGCDDDFCISEALQAVITTQLNAGTQYYIVVWQFDTPPPTSGNTAVQLLVSRILPPVNDTCAGAVALSLDTPVNGTTLTALNDYQLSGAGCFTGVGQTASTASGGDVVYSFTASSAASYSFKVTNYDIIKNLVLYVATTCPAGTPPVTVNTCLSAANRQSANSSEEVSCVALSSGQQVFVFVDESSLTAGNSFTIEVNLCTRETEPNDTPATASALACGVEGSINPAGDADFFNLGTPSAGSRVFAMIDGVAGNSSDFDLRVTTSVDTLEYDDSNADIPFGDLAPSVAGTLTTGSQTFLRVNHWTANPAPPGPPPTPVAAEPYRLYAVVQPTSASATPETEPNNTIGQANTAANNYFSGSLPGPAPSTDVDLFSFAANAGDLIFLSLDCDPLRDSTPVNGALALLDSSGTTLISVNDSGSTSSTTSGAGSLTATTPNSPAEGLVWRAKTTGTYYAKVFIGTSSIGPTGAGDYLLSISRNCVAGTAPTLSVASSNPASGVTIMVSPNDNNGQGNGVTPFTRVYNNNTIVMLTAPAAAGGNNFQKWQRDGVDVSTALTTSVTMDANHVMTALYITTGIGTDTAGLYNPTASAFFLRNANSTGVADVSFSYGPAGAGWIPLVGDWNGDGVDTIGLYNPATSTFFLRNANSTGVADLSFAFGPAGAGWLPIVGDWNGDGIDTVGLYNPTTSAFFLRNSNSTGVADLSFAYGPAGAGWLPIVGDWNGDGVDTIGLYNPAAGTFFLRNTNSTGVADVSFAYGPGGAGWKPLVGDWNSDGVDTIGLFNPTTSAFFLRNSNSTGVADVSFAYGPAGAGWTPLVGDWDGL